MMASIASRTIVRYVLASILLAAATLIFGRFFCGFVCPLGTTLDLFRSAVGRWSRGVAVPRNVKYVILLTLLISAIAGISYVHFVDPLVIFERFLAFSLYPLVTRLIGSFTVSSIVTYRDMAFPVALFGVILFLELLAARFWCRGLCPLGAFFGILSKVSILKFSFGGACSDCTTCERLCPVGAIDSRKREIDAGECISCIRCVHECPGHAIKYGYSRNVSRFDLKRRHLLGAFGASAVLVAINHMPFRSSSNSRLVRPPGAVPESQFLDLCVRCGKCMKVCPTNGLQPSFLEAGLTALWTPRLVPRIGGCEKDCNLCGQVCPTSAIRRLPLEEKTYAKMGTARIDRTRCISWNGNRICLICDEVCPYDAVGTMNRTISGITTPRPFVRREICVGCGLCESRCPTPGPAAIQVFRVGEERRRTGTYITEEKVRLRAQEKYEETPSGFILEGN